MPIPARGTKANGTAAWAAGDTVIAPEFNTDFDTLYTALDGSGSGGLDGENFDATPATPVPQTVIDDDSTNDTAYKLATATGDSASTSKPTNLAGEVRRLRYAIGRLAQGTTVTRVDGSGTTTAAWFDIPAKGRNLVSSPRFPYKTSAVSTDAPNFWTKVGTPTSLLLGTTDASEGSGNELRVVAGGSGQGVSQSIGFLKPSTRYLVVARISVASGTAALSTTGANASSSFRDVAIATTNSAFVTLAGMVETDATPTALLVRALSSGAAATFDVSYVGCFECSSDFTFDDIAVPGLLAEASSTSTGTTYNNAGWTAVPGGGVSVTIPGPGYGIKVHGWASGTINTGAGALDVRLTHDINGGGVAQKGGVVTTGFHAVTAKYTVNIYRAYESVTSGDEYVFALEGHTATNTVSSNGTSAGAAVALDSGIIVELVPVGA